MMWERTQVGVIFILKLELYNHAFPVITGKVWDFHSYEEFKKLQERQSWWALRRGKCLLLNFPIFPLPLISPPVAFVDINKAWSRAEKTKQNKTVHHSASPIGR